MQCFNYVLLHDTFVDDDPDRQSSSFDFILVFNLWDIFTLGIIIIIIITCLAFNPRDLCYRGYFKK